MSSPPSFQYTSTATSYTVTTGFGNGSNPFGKSLRTPLAPQQLHFTSEQRVDRLASKTFSESSAMDTTKPDDSDISQMTSQFRALEFSAKLSQEHQSRCVRPAARKLMRAVTSTRPVPNFENLQKTTRSRRPPCQKRKWAEAKRRSYLRCPDPELLREMQQRKSMIAGRFSALKRLTYREEDAAVEAMDQ